MKRFILRYLLSNRDVLNEVLIDLLRYLADQTDSPVDDVLVEELADFIESGLTNQKVPNARF